MMKSPDASFFIQNREATYEELRGGLLLVGGYSQMQFTNDIAAPFTQEANFWYLTGISHPDWWLFMDAKRRRSWLVAPDVADHQQLFDGSLSHDDAESISGIHDVIDRQAADSWLRQAARAHQLAYVVDTPPRADLFGFTLNPGPRELREKAKRTFTRVSDFRTDMATIRAIKRPLEIALIQQAVDVTVAAFNSVHDAFQAYRHEFEIEADFTRDFRRAAGSHAYDPIVASGANACTLHYVHNADKLKKGQLVLLDIGARSGGYAADITRTYAYGKPTKRATDVHDAVADAQREIIKLIEPGLGFDEYYDKVDDIMRDRLSDLKLLTDGTDDGYRTYFPHAIGHGLGVDVHDSFGSYTAFEPGMVVTVEPGVYIPEEGVGVRIEDDILVTDSGRRNMSTKLPTSL